MADRTVAIKLTLAGGNFNTGMRQAQQSANGLNASLAKQGTHTAQSAKGMDQVGKSSGMTALGMSRMSLAVGLGGAAVGKFAADSIEAASSLEEATNKTKVVFGSASDEVLEFGETAADSFALSERAAISAASGFGQFFDAAGMSQEASAGMSVDLTKLAADLASFNDIPIDEALEKLRSGLAGEAEPMRALGVFLSEGAVRSKALELGLVGAHGELSEGAKIQARYQLIMEGTTAAQGDMARTSDTLANRQRKLAAQVEDLKASVGESLVPALEDLTEVAIVAADALGFLFEKLAEGRELESGGKPIGKVLFGSLKDLGEVWVDAARDVGLFGEAQRRSNDFTFESADAAAQAAGAALGLTAAVENSTEVVAAWREEISKVASGFMEPLAAYTTTLAAKEEAERKTAQATADATESAEDSWETYATGVAVSVGEYLDELDRQVTAQDDWADNMTILAGRVSAGTLAELARMGPEGAPLVADLVNASDAEIKRLDDLMAKGSQDAMTAVANTITGAGPLLRHVAATSGQAAADSLARSLAAGTTNVESAAAAWGFAIDRGVPDTTSTTAQFLDATARSQLAAYHSRLAGIPSSVSTTLFVRTTPIPASIAAPRAMGGMVGAPHAQGGPIGAASGRLITPNYAAGDDQVISAKTGEFVVNDEATARYLPWLTAVNAGVMAAGPSTGPHLHFAPATVTA